MVSGGEGGSSQIRLDGRRARELRRLTMGIAMMLKKAMGRVSPDLSSASLHSDNDKAVSGRRRRRLGEHESHIKRQGTNKKKTRQDTYKRRCSQSTPSSGLLHSLRCTSCTGQSTRYTRGCSCGRRELPFSTENLHASAKRRCLCPSCCPGIRHSSPPTLLRHLIYKRLLDLEGVPWRC